MFPAIRIPYPQRTYLFPSIICSLLQTNYLSNTPIMRYILFFLIFTVLGCSGQKTSQQETVIDTVKLFNPTGYKDHGASDIDMFKRNIVLTQPEYYIILNDQEHKFETIEKLKEFININKEQIKKDLIPIIIDSATEFKRIVSVINILADNQVSKYKVINHQKYFAPVEPPTLQSPISVTTTKIENDSVYFTVTILKDGINVKLSGKETKLRSPIELDKFIANYKTEIDTKKILLVNSTNVPYDKFKPIIDIFKKYTYYKYSLITNSSQ